jgi:acyl phosphate:glycerol-3-phosphate acyltransferase
MVKYILLLFISFILGSIPFGIIIAKAKGINLKKVGSGNIGATNVLRSLGKWPAVLTLLGDVLKGTAAIAIGRYFGVEQPVYEGLIGFSAIMGHNFSIFLRFRGGKGVATSLGVLSIYSPQTALLTFIIWVMVVMFTRYSSMGALVSFGFLPINILFDDKEKLFAALLITILIFIRHKDNIQRLIKGTERKIGQRE